MGIGAEDDIDKLMIKKYQDESLILKSNYKDCKMKKDNYSPKDINIIKYDYHPCTIDYKDISTKFFQYRKDYDILTKHPKINKKKIDILNKKMKDLTNPNKMYERLGIDVIQIVIGNKLVPIVDPDYEDNLLVLLAMLRTKFVDTLGYITPNIRIMDSSKLEPYEYKLFVRNRLVFQSLLDKDLSDDNKKQEIIINLQKACIKYAPQIMSKADVLKLMELVRSQDPTLVNDLVPILLSPIDIKHVLTKLIQEQISIKDIIYIFELLNDYARYTNDIDILTEQLKRDLQF